MKPPKLSDRCSYCEGEACAWILMPGRPGVPGRRSTPAYQVSACFEHETSPNFQSNEVVARARPGARIIRKIRATENA